jgi:hypothetical protein
MAGQVSIPLEISRGPTAQRFARAGGVEGISAPITGIHYYPNAFAFIPELIQLLVQRVGTAPVLPSR